jgi:hypothetical protein
LGERRENEREDGVAHAGTHGLGITEAKEYIMDDDDAIAPGWSFVPADICIGTGEFLTNGDVGIIPDPDKDLKDVTPLEEYFERIRQAYGIELVGIIELGDMWNETDGKEDHGRQSRDGEDDYDAG